MCNGLDLVGGGQNKRLKARFQFKQILYNFARLFFFFTVYMSHGPDGDQGFTFKTPAAYYFITIKFSLVIAHLLSALDVFFLAFIVCSMR